MKPSEILAQAADLLESSGFVQDMLAFGVRKKDAEAAPKDKPPKAREVMPWDELSRLEGLSVLGAIYRASGMCPTATGDVVTQTLLAMSACCEALAAHGVQNTLEEWNDTPGRTKEEAASLLRSGIGRTSA